MSTLKNAINADILICNNCHFKCSKKSDWDRHVNTKKHKININDENVNIKSTKNICVCGKSYKERTGLWRHKQKCNNNNNNNNQTEGENIIINKKLTQDSSEVIHLTNLVIKLMNSNEEIQKQNGELHKQTLEMQQQMLDVCKKSNTIINNSNSNNKTFNMQVFLNEKCKDAMNLMDFVHSMMLDFSDLEELGELGYVEGISRQMVRKLNEMDVYKRPIHCSDLKRETMYVRDDDVWEKETELYEKLRKAIKYITKKNGDLMIPWRNAHPQCMNLQHSLNDKYLGIMNQAMGGPGEFAESESKIIRKISKCVTIDKKDM
jgi:hypothetical protein